MSAAGLLLLVFAVSLCPGGSRFTEPVTVIRHTSRTADMCSECKRIVQMCTNMISSRDTKETVYETLHDLCQHLPNKQASECDSQVKVYLPKVLRHTPGRLKPDVTCAGFSLCAAPRGEDMTRPLQAADEAEAALSTDTSSHELFNPACTLCLFIVKKLENLLPKNMTEDTLMKLMGEVCDLLPQSYEDQCEDFVDKYGAQIVEFLLSSAAPHTICTLLHICLFASAPPPEVFAPSDCTSCRTLAVLSRLHLGLNSSQPQTSSFLQSVCVHHPNAIPKCDAFTKIYGSQLQPVLGNQVDRPDVCQRAGLCAVPEKAAPLGKNPCTWGPSYWCKDVKTAQMCNNLSFCEKYMWKKNQ